MKKYILAALVLAILAGSALALWPRTGFCLGCLWTSACYNSSICGSGCVCVKRDSIDVSGYCAPL